MLNQEKNNAVTLIALVVTIVVLLILAGVSINLVVGDNGIIKKAHDAKHKHELGANKEQDDMQKLQEFIDEESNPLIHKNVIPNGGEYWICIEKPSDTNNWEGKYDDKILKAGDPFPEITKLGDKYFYKEYVYIFQDEFEHGWKVRLNYKIDNVQYKSSYSNVLEKINKNYIKDVSSLYSGCRELIYPPNMPKEVIDMTGTFSACYKLKRVPNIPNKVKHIDSLCDYSGNVEGDIPEFPESLETMKNAFWKCWKLKKSPRIPKNVKEASYAFYNTAIEGEIIVDAQSDLYDLLWTPNVIIKGTSPNLWYINHVPVPNKIIHMNEDIEEVGYVIPLGGKLYMNNKHYFVDEKIPELVDGTSFSYRDFVYIYNKNQNGWKVILNDKIQQAGVYSEFYKKPSKILNSIAGKNIIDISDLFGRSNEGLPIEESPEIPSTVINMDNTFKFCKNLKNAPILPKNVQTLNNTFYGCMKLIKAPIIPENVTQINRIFYGDNLLSNTVITINSNKITQFSQALIGIESATLTGTGKKEILNEIAKTGFNIIVQ